MAEILGRPTVLLDVTIQLTELEARALDALAGYGDDAFVKAFYEKLGKAYMEKYEGGLRSFLQSVRMKIPHLLTKAEKARATFHDPIPAVRPDELARRDGQAIQRAEAEGITTTNTKGQG